MAAAAFGEGDTVVAAQTAERSPDSGDRLNELAVWSLATGRRVMHGRTDTVLRRLPPIDRWRSARTASCGTSQP